MAKKFNGVEIIKKIDKALDEATAQFLTNTQSKLSASSPVDTGRLASSWNIGKNQPDLSAPPQNLGKPSERVTVNGTSFKVEGTNKVDISVKPYSGEITYGGDWFISSNLPYTQRAAFDPYNGRRGGGDWFTRIENGLSKDIDRIFQRALSQIK
jgi:hypothetical protein